MNNQEEQSLNDSFKRPSKDTHNISNSNPVVLNSQDSKKITRWADEYDDEDDDNDNSSILSSKKIIHLSQDNYDFKETNIRGCSKKKNTDNLKNSISLSQNSYFTNDIQGDSFEHHYTRSSRKEINIRKKNDNLHFNEIKTNQNVSEYKNDYNKSSRVIHASESRPHISTVPFTGKSNHSRLRGSFFPKQNYHHRSQVTSQSGGCEKNKHFDDNENKTSNRNISRVKQNNVKDPNVPLERPALFLKKILTEIASPTGVSTPCSSNQVKNDNAAFKISESNNERNNSKGIILDSERVGKNANFNSLTPLQNNHGDISNASLQLSKKKNYLKSSKRCDNEEKEFDKHSISSNKKDIYCEGNSQNIVEVVEDKKKDKEENYSDGIIHKTNNNDDNSNNNKCVESLKKDTSNFQVSPTEIGSTNGCSNIYSKLNDQHGIIHLNENISSPSIHSTSHYCEQYKISQVDPSYRSLLPKNQTYSNINNSIDSKWHNETSHESRFLNMNAIHKHSIKTNNSKIHLYNDQSHLRCNLIVMSNNNSHFSKSSPPPPPPPPPPPVPPPVSSGLSLPEDIEHYDLCQNDNKILKSVYTTSPLLMHDDQGIVTTVLHHENQEYIKESDSPNGSSESNDNYYSYSGSIACVNSNYVKEYFDADAYNSNTIDSSVNSIDSCRNSKMKSSDTIVYNSHTFNGVEKRKMPNESMLNTILPLVENDTPLDNDNNIPNSIRAFSPPQCCYHSSADTGLHSNKDLKVSNSFSEHTIHNSSSKEQSELVSNVPHPIVISDMNCIPSNVNYPHKYIDYSSCYQSYPFSACHRILSPVVNHGDNYIVQTAHNVNNSNNMDTFSSSNVIFHPCDRIDISKNSKVPSALHHPCIYSNLPLNITTGNNCHSVDINTYDCYHDSNIFQTGSSDSIYASQSVSGNISAENRTRSEVFNQQEQNYSVYGTRVVLNKGPNVKDQTYTTSKSVQDDSFCKKNPDEMLEIRNGEEKRQRRSRIFNRAITKTLSSPAYREVFTPNKSLDGSILNSNSLGNYSNENEVNMMLKKSPKKKPDTVEISSTDNMKFNGAVVPTINNSNLVLSNFDSVSYSVTDDNMENSFTQNRSGKVKNQLPLKYSNERLKKESNKMDSLTEDIKPCSKTRIRHPVSRIPVQIPDCFNQNDSLSQLSSLTKKNADNVAKNQYNQNSNVQPYVSKNVKQSHSTDISLKVKRHINNENGYQNKIVNNRSSNSNQFMKSQNNLIYPSEKKKKKNKFKAYSYTDGVHNSQEACYQQIKKAIVPDSIESEQNLHEFDPVFNDNNFNQTLDMNEKLVCNISCKNEKNFSCLRNSYSGRMNQNNVFQSCTVTSKDSSLVPSISQNSHNAVKKKYTVNNSFKKNYEGLKYDESSIRVNNNRIDRLHTSKHSRSLRHNKKQTQCEDGTYGQPFDFQQLRNSEYIDCHTNESTSVNALKLVRNLPEKNKSFNSDECNVDLNAQAISEPPASSRNTALLDSNNEKFKCVTCFRPNQANESTSTNGCLPSVLTVSNIGCNKKILNKKKNESLSGSKSKTDPSQRLINYLKNDSLINDSIIASKKKKIMTSSVKVKNRFQFLDSDGRDGDDDK